MFIKLFGYQIRRMLRNRSNLFWSLIFPILLGTMFYLGFGSAMKNDESFQTIPVAMVSVEEGSSEYEEYQTLYSTMKDITYNDDKDMFKLHEVTEKKAKKLLNDGKVKGYVMVDGGAKLRVKETGISQTIVETFMDKYLRMKDILTEVATKNPEKLPEVMATLSSDVSHVADNPKDEAKKLDPMLGYFYALLAMACIYGCFWGSDNVFSIKADISPLGMRRCVTPTNKMLLVLADSLAAIVLHALEMLIVLCYLRYALNVGFGNNFGLVYLACVIGSVIGVSFGSFVAAVAKGSENMRTGIVLGGSMLLCFLSGLMIVDIKYAIEKVCPIINRINPCTMLVDALYSLNVYDSTAKYWNSIIGMLVVAGLLSIGSILVLRREKYASL